MHLISPYPCYSKIVVSSPKFAAIRESVDYVGMALTRNTVVSRKYAPPFATLASAQNAGEAYTQDATISLAITPSLPVPVSEFLSDAHFLDLVSARKSIFNNAHA